MRGPVTLPDGSLAVTSPRRVAAKSIDVAIALLVSGANYPLGWLVGFVYLALGDRRKKGTLGSRICRIRVLPAVGMDRLPRSSAFFRNLSVLTVLSLFQVPLWGGWLAGFATLGLAAVNGYLLWGCGVRDGLGNLMGEARVVNAPPRVAVRSA